MLHSIKATNFL